MSSGGRSGLALMTAEISSLKMLNNWMWLGIPGLSSLVANAAKRSIRAKIGKFGLNQKTIKNYYKEH